MSSLFDNPQIAAIIRELEQIDDQISCFQARKEALQVMIESIKS